MILKHWLAIAVFISIPCFAWDEPKEKEEVKTREAKAGELTLMVPETWTEQEPENKLRLAQFEIPSAEGDEAKGELVVFNFGKEGGGEIDANVKRWFDQFARDDRKMKRFKGESKSGKYVLVEIDGTWNKTIGPPVLMKTEKMPGTRMLAVILSVEDQGNYFLRLAGPEKTIEQASEDFRKSFEAKLDLEKEDKPEDKKEDTEEDK